MAGDWLKFEVATLDKPEVCQIADEAGIDIDAVVGKLLRVWSWFDQQTGNGNAPSVTKKLLDRFVGVPGFCEMMKKSGWMIDDGVNISLPNFERHNGNTAKNRALTAKRAANHRTKSNATIVTGALPREEKILEDKDLLSSDESENQKQEPKKIAISQIVEAYNSTCGHVLPKVMSVTEARKKQIRAMGAIEIETAFPFRDFGVDFWKAYFVDALKDPHKRGENDRGWRADFDFLTNPKNALKILEKNHVA